MEMYYIFQCLCFFFSIVAHANVETGLQKLRHFKTQACGSIAKGDSAGMGRSLMRDLSLTAAQAAGIVGNMIKESGIQNARAQHSPWNSERPLRVDGVTGYGIVQWTSRGRQQGLYNYAQSRGHDMSSPLTMDIEYNYFLQELQGPYDYVLTAIRRTSDVMDSSTIFMQRYEVPAGYRTQAKIDERYHASAPVYNMLNAGQGVAGGCNGSAPSSPFQPGTQPSSSSGKGQVNGACTDGSRSGTCITSYQCSQLGGIQPTPQLCLGNWSIKCCFVGAQGSPQQQAQAPGGGKTTYAPPGGVCSDGSQNGECKDANTCMGTRGVGYCADNSNVCCFPSSSQSSWGGWFFPSKPQPSPYTSTGFNNNSGTNSVGTTSTTTTTPPAQSSWGGLGGLFSPSKPQPSPYTSTGFNNNSGTNSVGTTSTTTTTPPASTGNWFTNLFSSWARVDG